MTSRPSGRTSWTPRSAFEHCRTADGRDRLITSGKKAVRARTRRATPMQKSVPLWPMPNSTGADGDNPRAPCHRSTPASCGPSRSRRTPLNMRATTARPRTSTGREPAWCLPTPWAAKTATCPTSACGQTTPSRWPSPTASPRARSRVSPRPCSKAPLVWMRTPCRVNSRTWSRVVWRTCSTFKGPTTPWTLHALLPWPRCWMPAAFCRRVRSTSCSPGPPTARWTLRRLPNFQPLVLFHPATPRRLMLVPTGS